MVITKDQMQKEIKVNMRDGDGEVELLHLVDPKSLKNARLLSYMTLPRGASIGSHEHINETEYYIIIKGNGTVKDNGNNKYVKAGDVVVTTHGEKHSIKNTGSEPLELIAVIITF